MRRRYLQRRKPRRSDATDSALLHRLREFQFDCKSEKLSLECAMAECLQSVVRFDFSFRTRPFCDSMTHLSMMRKQLKNLRNIIEKEYPFEPEAEEETNAQASSSPQCENPNRKDDCAPPRVVWADGNGAQQETGKQA